MTSEEELVRTAARLGDQATGQLDPERITQAVLVRLATEPERAATPLRRIIRPVLAVLATAALILLAVRLTTSPVPPTAPSSLSVLHELDDLDASQLENLLETLPASATTPLHPESTTYEELDTKSLERLLRSLEG